MKKRILSILLCLVMVVTLLPMAALAAGRFTDVTTKDWFYNDVEYAVEQGLVNGVNATTYAPNSNLTYAAAVKLAACIHKKVTKGNTDFTVGSPWYQVYVDYARVNGIIPAGKTYDWDANATRAGYMEIFANAIPDRGLRSGYSPLTNLNTVEDGAIPDVPTTHPQADAIYKLYRAGILQGDENHNCTPNSFILRSEVAAILTRMIDADARIAFQLKAHTFSQAAQQALDGLQDCRNGELFAATYLGHREAGDTSSLNAWLHNEDPFLASVWPFLLEIPQADILGTYGDLYCVVPLDKTVSFTVKGVEWETGGNGSTPHYSDPQYYPQDGRPFLLYVTHGTWRDETNLTLEYVKQNGFVGTWFPTYDTETGSLASYDRGIALDFGALYDVGDDIPHLNAGLVPDAEWLPPTNVGLGNTKWYSDNGWVLEFRYDESADKSTGDMVLYQPVAGEGSTTLSPYYSGSWWMDGDSLRLGVYDGHGAFPLLISPSGEQMVIMQADDGSVLPFFEKGQTTCGMTYSYT